MGGFGVGGRYVGHGTAAEIFLVCSVDFCSGRCVCCACEIGRESEMVVLLVVVVVVVQ